MSWLFASDLFIAPKLTVKMRFRRTLKKNLKSLKKKAEIYRQIVEIKEKQGESISNQLYITEANLNQVQTQIELSTRQIEEYNSR